PARLRRAHSAGGRRPRLLRPGRSLRGQGAGDRGGAARQAAGTPVGGDEPGRRPHLVPGEVRPRGGAVPLGRRGGGDVARDVDVALVGVAPWGRDDRPGLAHRRNPRRVTVAEYERRLATKRISERWPKATIEAAV